MLKYGMYTKGTNESSQHINVVETPDHAQAEAYFAGVKRLTLEQFRNLFVVKEIKSNFQNYLTNAKNLLLG